MADKGVQERLPNDLDELLVKYRGGEITDEERKVLDAWAGADPWNRQMLDCLGEPSRTRDELNEMRAYNRQGVWETIRRVDRERSRVRFRNLFSRYAVASVVLVAMVAAFFTDSSVMEGGLDHNLLSTIIVPGHRHAFLRMSDGSVIGVGGEHEIKQFTERDNTHINIQDDVIVFDADASRLDTSLVYSSVSVPAGGDFSLILSDGSQVWLNSESSIRFPTKFSGSTREVTITGEAYFEVTRDAGHPFVVTANGQKVTVFGTSFNLSAYDNDDNIKTTLVTGSVLVEMGGKQVLLVPGQQAQFIPSTGEMSLRAVDAASYMAWTRGAFVFFDESIGSICRALARWYKVDIDASAPGLEHLRYSGVIKREDTFNRIADLLASTDEMAFVERGNVILVIPK